MADSPTHGADDLMGDRDFNKPDGRVEGEGSYNATKAYHDRLKRFIKERGDQVEEAQSSSGSELLDAEKDGLSKTRH